MKPRIYVETSVISYLTARPSRDLITAARQQLTQEWWEGVDLRFDAYVSDLVKREVSQGDTNAAQRRLAICEALQAVPLNAEAIALGKRLVKAGCVPVTEPEDALHIALACVHEFDYLATWNFAHFVGASAKDRLLMQLRSIGLKPALLVTPEELLESGI